MQISGWTLLCVSVCVSVVVLKAHEITVKTAHTVHGPESVISVLESNFSVFAEINAAIRRKASSTVRNITIKMAAIKIPCAWMIIRVGSRVILLLRTATLRPSLGVCSSFKCTSINHLHYRCRRGRDCSTALIVGLVLIQCHVPWI